MTMNTVKYWPEGGRYSNDQIREVFKGTGPFVGFMDKFIPMEGTICYTDKSTRIPGLEVYVQKASFGKQKNGDDMWCYIVTTYRLELNWGHHPMGGWGQHGFMDESVDMQIEAIRVIEQFNLTISRIVNNWPTFIAVVTKLNKDKKGNFIGHSDIKEYFESINPRS